MFALHEVASQLEADAIWVLVEVGTRLVAGRKAYGVLDVHGDSRSWRGEATAEALDLAAYLAMELLRQRGTP